MSNRADQYSGAEDQDKDKDQEDHSSIYNQDLNPIVLDLPSKKSPLKLMIEEEALSRKISPASAQGASLFILLFTIMSIISWQSSRELFVATQQNVFQGGEWWRLITSPFVHADFLHLLSNSMLFLVFATLLNNYFGRWAFPFLSVLGASATQAIALLTYDPQVRLVGASGMVYLMAGMWLVYFAKNSSYLPLTHRLMRIGAFILVVLLPSTIEAHVSYRSHGIGFGLGVFMAWMSLPWVKPKPLNREEYSRAQAKAMKRRRFLEEDDDVLTYLALRVQPNRQSLLENEAPNQTPQP